MDSRIKTALGVYAFLTVGLFLVAVPWTPVWSVVLEAVLPPDWAARLGAPWVRGVVTGLGVVDLVVALQGGAELLRRTLGSGTLRPPSS